MPRNLETYVYIPVPIRKDSSLLAHLKDEAQRVSSHKRMQLGPYIFSLLEERDHQLYGDGGVRLAGFPPILPLWLNSLKPQSTKPWPQPSRPSVPHSR